MSWRSGFLLSKRWSSLLGFRGRRSRTKESQLDRRKGKRQSHCLFSFLTTPPRTYHPSLSRKLTFKRLHMFQRLSRQRIREKKRHVQTIHSKYMSHPLYNLIFSFSLRRHRSTCNKHLSDLFLDPVLLIMLIATKNTDDKNQKDTARPFLVRKSNKAEDQLPKKIQ